MGCNASKYSIVSDFGFCTCEDFITFKAKACCSGDTDVVKIHGRVVFSFGEVEECNDILSVGKVLEENGSSILEIGMFGNQERWSWVTSL